MECTEGNESQRFSLSQIVRENSDPVLYERLETLRRTLQEFGVPLRDDSRLAFYWAMNQLPNNWNLKRVVRELVLLHHLYNRTDYSRRLRLIVPSVKQHLRTFSNMTSEQIHMHIHQFVLPGIRWQTLLDHNILDPFMTVLALQQQQQQ